MRRLRAAKRASVLLTAAVVSVSGFQAPAIGAPAKDKATALAGKLVKQVSAASANRHLIALQRIADSNGGTRAANTPGYDASVKYVANLLRNAGFIVRTPAFTYPEEVADATTVTVGSADYHIDKMEFSLDTPAGGITGPLVVVPEDATPGCEASDYAGQDFTGAVALIRRGACTFAVKAQLAAAAGASVAVISNNVAGPLTNVTLGEEGPIPVGGISQADGDALAALGGSTTTVRLEYHTETRTSHNIIAQTRTGRTDNVVMAGAHLDSVPAGPGINDNGSGAAGLLELALKMGGSPKVNNAVRLGWWGAEELGLIGSTKYVQSLTFNQQLNIAMYLNFDMIASPNAGYFVYDGNDSDQEGAGPGPYGSAQIEKTFTDFLTGTLDVPTQGTDFDGRSDYGEFILNGIPAGGLFTGAEEVKTVEQATLWGGTAGAAFDPCYHQACDNLGNVDRVALDRNLDAMAWAVGVYAYSTEAVNGVPARSERAKARAAAKSALANGAAAGDQAA